MSEHEQHEPNTPDDIPPLEDASEPETHGDVVDDDEREMELDVAARSLGETDQSPVDEELAAAAGQEIDESSTDDDDDLSDVAQIPDPPVTTASARRPQRVGDWQCEVSAHKVVVELKRIENEVRTLLEGVDQRRKRKLNGTSRWQELEEDLIAWRYGGRVPEDSLRRIQELISRRNYLFQHLRFLASTRPVLNS